MFTTEHFIWLAICAAFIAVMTAVSVKKGFGLKLAGGIMVGFCIISEVCKVMTNMLKSENSGMHLDPLCLPFHLCSLMIFVVFYITFGKDGRLKQMCINFLSVMGTVGSFFALLIPTNGVDFLDILSYQCFVYHAALMWFAIYLIATKKAVLGFKSWATNLSVLAAVTFLMLYVNSALSVYDTNFFYLTRPPMEGLPILNLDNGWYIYFLTLAAIGVILVTLFHLPFIIAEAKSKKADR